MKRYIVKLEAEERAELEAITRKGSHRSLKVINTVDSSQLRQERVQRAMQKSLACQHAQGRSG